MSNYDVRGEPSVITIITFADGENAVGTTQAYRLLHKDGSVHEPVMIEDDQEDYVYITSKAHALNLIKALEKAITIGWLK